VHYHTSFQDTVQVYNIALGSKNCSGFEEGCAVLATNATSKHSCKIDSSSATFDTGIIDSKQGDTSM